MTAPTVLVVGDANPDLILTGDTVPRFGQAEQLLDSAGLLLGGSAAIVACGLARLGIATALAAVVGDDQFGRFVLGELERLGVDTRAISIDPGRQTGLSVILNAGSDRSILTLPGTIPALTAAHVRGAVERVRPQRLHVASYFLQPGLAAELPALLDWLAERRIPVSIDTNWDPAENWAGLEEVLPKVETFLPNREEALAVASALAGRRIDGLDAAGRLLAERGCRVVVKAGAAGGISFRAGADPVAGPGLTLDVVDTTGAGDSFDAGYIAASAYGIEPEAERVRWAAVAGSLSTRGAGGTAAQATRAELAATA